MVRDALVTSVTNTPPTQTQRWENKHLSACTHTRTHTLRTCTHQHAHITHVQRVTHTHITHVQHVTRTAQLVQQPGVDSAEHERPFGLRRGDLGNVLDQPPHLQRTKVRGYWEATPARRGQCSTMRTHTWILLRTNTTAQGTHLSRRRSLSCGGCVISFTSSDVRMSNHTTALCRGRPVSLSHAICTRHSHSHCWSVQT